MSYLSKGNLFALLISSFCILSANSQDILWEKSYGGKHSEYLFDAIPTPDYGFILAGSSISNKNGNKSDNGKGNFDYWIWKMNEKGDAEWQKSFGGSGMDLLQSIQLTSDAGFILAGTSTSNKDFDKKENSKGNSDFWIIKLDATGGEIWQKTIGGTGQEKLHSIIQTKDGGYILGGSSSSDKTPKDEAGKEDKYGKREDSRGSVDYWVVKLNKEGEIEWQKTIGGAYDDELKNIVSTKDGGYLLGGYSNSPISGEKTDNNIGVGDFWIVKIDSKGDIQWQKTIGGDQDDNLSALLQTKDGGYIIGGNSNSGATNSKTKANSSGTDFWVVKLFEDGTIDWQETYNYGNTDVLTSIVENEDGTYLIGGFAKSEKGKKSKTDKEGINDYIALKINNKGEEIWTQTIGSKGDDVLKKLFELRDGGYLLIGTSNGEKSRDKNSEMGNSDFWVVKLKDKVKKEKVKTDLEAMPNPAVSYTNAIVNYDYKTGTIALYDLNGRELLKEKINGEKTIPVHLGNLPQGIYIINIKTNKGDNSIKVIKQ